MPRSSQKVHAGVRRAAAWFNQSSEPTGVAVTLAKRFACALSPGRYVTRMPVTSTLANQLRRLSPREKAALADHLWREAEPKLSPSTAQIDLLNARAVKAIAHPSKLKPAGHAVRRLRR